LIEQIRKKIKQRKYEFSKHALDQSIIRNISIWDFEEAVIHSSEVIEDYPMDKYGPSCLILCFTTGGKALHVVCTHPGRDLLKVITMYEPDPLIWIDFKIRKQQ